MPGLAQTLITSTLLVGSAVALEPSCQTNVQNLGLTPPLPIPEKYGGGYVEGDIVECITYDGRDRCFLLPPKPATRDEVDVPLLINMHGFTSCAEDGHGYMGWQQYFDKFGLDVLHVKPQATENLDLATWPTWLGPLRNFPAWNSGTCCGAANKFGFLWEHPTYGSHQFKGADIDDVGFIKALAGHLIQTRNVDPSRVYLTGHSNGCSMAQRIGFEEPWVAAVSCFAEFLLGVDYPEEIRAKASDFRPTPVQTFHGEQDKVVGYQPGGGSDYLNKQIGTQRGAQMNLGQWAGHNECDMTSLTTSHLEGIFGEFTPYKVETYERCALNTKVSLVTIPSAGHTPYSFSDGAGDVPVNDIAWKFLSAHSNSEASQYFPCPASCDKYKKGATPEDESYCFRLKNDRCYAVEDTCKGGYVKCLNPNRKEPTPLPTAAPVVPTNKPTPRPTKFPVEPVVCTMDVQECCDGSFVSRNPEKGCSFRACPRCTEPPTTQPPTAKPDVPACENACDRFYGDATETDAMFCQKRDKCYPAADCPKRSSVLCANQNPGSSDTIAPGPEPEPEPEDNDDNNAGLPDCGTCADFKRGTALGAQSYCQDEDGECRDAGDCPKRKHTLCQNTLN